jgi:uncharacterized protein (TIGR02246 family)
MNQTSTAENVTARLQDAWNAANGAAFAAPFAPDADFVNVRGDMHSGRDAIAAGHQQIFDTIYAGSTLRYTVRQARELDDGVILVHIDALLSVPAGPLAGEIPALASLVLVRDGDEYRIAAFHNTAVAAT